MFTNTFNYPQNYVFEQPFVVSSATQSYFMVALHGASCRGGLAPAGHPRWSTYGSERCPLDCDLITNAVNVCFGKI
jgi:hypothetical protein